MTTVVPIDRASRRRRRARAAHPAARTGRPRQVADRPRTGAPEPRTPDPERLVIAVARAFLEVEAGLRPVSQLTPLLCPALDLRLAATVRSPRADRPSIDAIRSVRCVELPGGGVEAVVVVRRGQRCGALAVRAERHDGVWRIVEIARPEEEDPGAASGSVEPLVALS